MDKNALIILKKYNIYKEIQIANHVFDLIPFLHYTFNSKKLYVKDR